MLSCHVGIYPRLFVSMSYLILFIIGFTSWFIGTIAAGGAGLIFIVVATFVLPISVIPIIVGFTGTIAGFYRALIYRNDVDWPILKWLLPGTVIGSLAGASLFASVVSAEDTEFLKVILGFVLILSGLVGAFKEDLANFKGRKWYFLPFGLATSILSGLIGASSPVVNILFQKFPLTPNQIVGTKAINIFVLQITKSIVYAVFLMMGTTGEMMSGTDSLGDYLVLGIVTAVGASIGVNLGKKVLSNIDEKLFKKVMNLMLVVFGLRFLIGALL